MDLRCLGIAFTIGYLAVTPSTILAKGADRGGGSQADAGAPRGPAVAGSGAARPTTAGRAPRGTRSHAGRRVRVFAAVPYPTDSNELDSDALDTAPPPSAASPSAEPSSIQPLPPSAPQPSQPLPRGNLWLAVGPNTAQVYVDGFYVGTVEDCRRTATGLSLAAGWHRLEFRAPGYETPAVNVTIEPNHLTSYQGELRPTQP
jgi:PEGA domain